MIVKLLWVISGAAFFAMCLVPAPDWPYVGRLHFQVAFGVVWIVASIFFADERRLDDIKRAVETVRRLQGMETSASTGPRPGQE